MISIQAELYGRMRFRIPSVIENFPGVGLPSTWIGSSRTGQKDQQQDAGIAAPVERRSRTRVDIPYQAVLDLSGVCMSIRVRGVNLHKAGAMVIAARPLRVGSVVFFHDQTHCNLGFARVRHSTPSSSTEFQIGLEFEGKLMHAEPGAWHVQRIARD